MEVVAMSIPDVKLIKPTRHGDHRGFFSETYNRRALSSVGIDLDFVQDNHSLSEKKHTLRGLHFQTPPWHQSKLLRVVRGSILDVAVDIRHGSPTFGAHVCAIVSAKEWNQILVPSGFAHGVLTLEEGTELLYKVTDYYSPEHDKGLLWHDPELSIDWGVDADDLVISDKDLRHPPLRDLGRYFTYTGGL